VIGILAVVAVPKMSTMSAVQQRSDRDKVFSALEYARKAAIAQRRYVCLSASSSALSLTVDPNPPEATAIPFGGTCPFANTLALPKPDPSCAATNQTCVKTTSISSTSGVFQFGPLGNASAQVSVTVSGFSAITVESQTGYVH